MSFYERSSSGTVRVMWEKAGESDALQSHREEAGLVSLVLYGQLVSLLGTVTILTLTDVRQEDKGNYTLTVSSDINGVAHTSSTRFYVDVTEKPSAKKDTSGNHAGANSGAIVGGVLGGFLVVVTSIFTVIVVILWRRSKTKALPEGTENRQMSPAGDLIGEMRTISRPADTHHDPAVNINHNYESLAHNIARNPGSRDVNYESMTSPTRSGDNMYENTEGTKSNAEAARSEDRANYQNV
ncbi:uncharacterized protein LOC135463969 [Liolophura sinensis]|uniref:uncharacterized protein LOC135463969 n=1 Tax=Liolophura sinensis TaxID=3198878 RepID=UPI00315816D6